MPGSGSPPSAVRDQPVRPVGHRDHEPAPAAGPPALDQRGEDLRHRAERPRREVGDLDRRVGGSGVREHARPAEVVEVVARAPASAARRSP